MDEAPEQRGGCCSEHPFQEPHFRDTSWEETTQPREQDTGRMAKPGAVGSWGARGGDPVRCKGGASLCSWEPAEPQAGLKVAGLVFRGARQGCTEDPNHP